MRDNGDGLLSGLRVLDLGIWRPVPYATQLMAEMGADVLKIEPPGGDPMRAFPGLFGVLNARKRSIMADLKNIGDRERILDLASGADVVTEGFRPGVADRLGIGYPDVAATNPRVVYCSISGYGQDGPLAHVPGHDVNFQAYAGVLAPDGGEPSEPTLPVADLAAGMAAAMATLAACYRVAAGGNGERIDIAMADVLATWTGAAEAHTDSDASQSLDGVPGYGIYATCDGRHVTLGVVAEDHLWAALCASLGLDDHAHLGFAQRRAQATVLDAVVRDAISRLTAVQALETLHGFGVPAAPVLDRHEVLRHPNFRARGVVSDHTAPGRGTDIVMGHPARYKLHPAREYGPAPGLDEHRGERWRERPAPA